MAAPVRRTMHSSNTNVPFSCLHINSRSLQNLQYLIKNKKRVPEEVLGLVVDLNAVIKPFPEKLKLQRKVFIGSPEGSVDEKGGKGKIMDDLHTLFEGLRLSEELERARAPSTPANVNGTSLQCSPEEKILILELGHS